MTTGHDSLAVLLAASIFGPATGNPFQDAMRTAALTGAARLGEMSQTGFTTNVPFENVCQPTVVDSRKPFLLVSLGTNTTYFVVVTERVGPGDLRVAIAVHQEGQNPKVENLRKMTLRCGLDGKVHAVPGW